MKGNILKIKQFLLIIFVILCVIISPSTSAISDKRLCYDPKCSVAVSMAKTLSNYMSNDPDILSFPVNADVVVYSKEAGSRKDLWGVEINGKRGFAPINFIREKIVIQKVLQHEVPTKNIDESESIVPSSIDSSVVEKNDADSVVQQQVSPSFEVIDGTTVHISSVPSPQDDSYATKILQDLPASEEQPVLSVHPSIFSSEMILQEDASAETVDLQTVTNVTADTELLKEKDDVVDDEISKEESSDNPFNQIQNSTEKFDAPKNETLEAEAETEQNSPLQNEDELSDKTVEVEKEMEENEEEEKEEDEEEKEEDGGEKEEDEEEEEEDIDMTTASSDLAADILVNTFHRVTAMFPSLMTTEIPPVDETPPVDEAPSVDEAPAVDETPSVDEVAAVNEASFINEMLSENEDKDIEIETKDSILEGNTTLTPLDINPENHTLSKIIPLVNKTENFQIDNAVNASELIDFSNQLSDDNETETAENNSKQIFTPYEQSIVNESDELKGASQSINVDQAKIINELPAHRNLLNIGNILRQSEYVPVVKDEPSPPDVNGIPENITEQPVEIEIPSIETTTEVTTEIPHEKIITDVPEPVVQNDTISSDLPEILKEESAISLVTEEEPTVIPSVDVCEADGTCEGYEQKTNIEDVESEPFDEKSDVNSANSNENYWETMSYLALTAFTTLLFSLGYYYIENGRRDRHLIAKINKLEKELFVSIKECNSLDESLKSTKNKLTSIEDESFGSNEMVASLKSELDAAHKSKAELEDQVSALEKDLESATEAGLELERMLREILASNNAENPLTKSIEDLQTRLNAQQAANESLTNSLQLKIQENEALSKELSLTTEKCEQLEVELTRIKSEYNVEKNSKQLVEKSLTTKVSTLEKQLKELSAERITLKKQLKGKETEIQDLLEVVKQSNTSSIDFNKLSDISQAKAEASQLLEERDELKIRLSEVEGAHQLLEEHMKIINEEVGSLSEQCKLAEKEKKDAEKRLEVLSEFFKEKEAEHKKQEALWMLQQEDGTTDVNRLQTMQNEIENLKQQIGTLKREIVDQESDYKVQISNLEAKAHDQWLLARQSDRRLEEAKAESALLRNRLTLVGKNLSEAESDVKLHRMEKNGETRTSPLYMGADTSSSPIMFSGPMKVPPLPPPSFLYGQPMPPFMPPPLPPLPPFDSVQRPPPLGGRLASPPPMPLHPSVGRYDSPGSPPPPPLSPSMLPPNHHHHHHHRNHPPMPFGNDRMHPPPPLPGTWHTPPFGNPNWGDDILPPPRNSGFHPSHREPRPHEHKDSLHSSRESLDKNHRNEDV